MLWRVVIESETGNELSVVKDFFGNTYTPKKGDVLMINVKDAAIFSSSHSQASHIKTSQKRISQVYSIEKEGYLSEFFTKDKKLAKLQEEKQQNIYKECVDKLKRYGIPFTTINHTQEIDQTLIKFL